MKILNLDVDDLFVHAEYQNINTDENTSKTVLVLPLGEELPNLPNKIIFDKSGGWDITQNNIFLRNTFRIKNTVPYPTVLDEGVRLFSNKNLLFTGVYAKDSPNILTETKIVVDKLYMVNSIDVIAGGLRQDPQGKPILNLVLAVPTDIQYQIYENIYSTDNDKDIPKTEGFRIELNELLPNTIK